MAVNSHDATQPAAGLSSAEARARLLEVGPNVVALTRRRSALVRLLSRFRNPLVLLLLAASTIAAATGDVPSSTIIIVVVVLSVVLDFVQEDRAGRAAERLRRSAAVHASVLRDGAIGEVPAEDIVPGDLVLLSAGDLVPADGKLVEVDDLYLNEALLTGEPYPVEKRVGESSDTSAVFMGSSVVTGSGKAVITQTGSATQFGQIGLLLERQPPPTEFELGTRRFGMLILRLALLMVLFVLLTNVVRGRPWLESFMFATALAVGLTPELLPMVVSVTLARGALSMSKQKVLVKRLAAIHDLGSMDVLCTDKTGTLTEARIRLEQHMDANGTESARVLELAYLNSCFESGIRSPLDQAILANPVDTRGWEKIDEAPFDFERRRLSVLIRKGDSWLLIVKGAFEDVLRACTRYEAAPDDLRAIDAAQRSALLDRFADLSRAGFRVLGIAWKAEVPGTRKAAISDEAELVFAGFAVFQDPPKESAGATMKALAAAGVSVVIVTGDNELVAQHLCQSIGVRVLGVVTGNQLEHMDDHALQARVESTNLFCRVNPAQKNRVIHAFRQRGRVVGYLGDGINDAPSLQTADVGISVSDAVDVAREAADLILLERDLAVVVDGVREGRRTLGNILKYIMMGTSSNFGNMFSMAGASLFLPFLPMLPVQILVNNLLYDLSELPIPTDRVDEEYLARPHRWDMKFIRRFMITIGPVSSLFDAATFLLLLYAFHSQVRLFHTGWFIESLATQVLVIFLIPTRSNPLRSRPSGALILTSLTVVVIALLLPFSPLGTHIGFDPPPAIFFVILVPLVLSYLISVEVVKRWFYRRYG